ncbi:MAG TPA: bifunctional phosphoglucose/phosphomannose isomerase [Candidatus Saccharimonadales bacterium]|nr:bifunctional phosphoglucose/phosphomannose isomerase [Candidatus Saccharimonadales bacterium]
MLDDQNFIAQKDPQDLLGVVATSPAQLAHVYEPTGPALPSKDQIDTVVVAGMGGSAWPAETLQVWGGLQVPLVVSRTYMLPAFVNDRTLVLVSSFSGNTEETLSALDDAKKRSAKIAVISHGGKLKERAAAENLTFLQVPDCTQPRAAANFTLKAMATVLEKVGLISGACAELEKVAAKYADLAKEWTADAPTAHNAAKQLAEEIMGKTPIIYGGILGGSALKWKIFFNENAKNLAWWNQLPEFNHNEFIGWSSHPIDKPFAVINLLSSFDHPRVQERFVVSEKMLSGMRPESIDIQAKGDSLIEQIIWVELFGSMISVYVALLNGVNPTPVDLVEKFKKELG